MSIPDIWKVTTEARLWHGNIFLNGRRVWFCPHDHYSQREARACAREKLKTLQERKA